MIENYLLVEEKHCTFKKVSILGFDSFSGEAALILDKPKLQPFLLLKSL